MPSVVELATGKDSAAWAVNSNTAKTNNLKQYQQAEEAENKKGEKIGSFGSDLVFEVNSRKILTAKNWKRTQNGRWETHNILNQAPRSEFLGPDRLETTLTITLDATHGVKPKQMILLIEEMIRKGTAEYLVLGGQIYGWDSHKFVITGASEAWDIIFNKGELAKATMDLTFEEYW